MPRKARRAPWLDTIGDVYYAFWYDSSKRRTKRQSLYETDPARAAIAFAEFLSQGRDVFERPSVEALTVDAALDHYWHEHVLEKVEDSGRMASRVKHLRAHFGRLLISDIDIPLCRRYAEKRRSGAIGNRATDGTIRGELVALTAALNHEARWKRVKYGDIPYVEKPAEPPGRSRWLTKDELAAVLAACADDLPVWGFVNLAYYTAARRTSLEQLTWFQWPEDRPIITLNPEGRRQTKKRRPTVRADAALRPVRARLWEAFGDTGYVLGSRRNLWYPVRQVLDRLGLEDVVPHTFRHTRATHLLQDGKSLYDVADLLGDTITTVDRRYGHHRHDYMEDVVSCESQSQD